LVKNILQSHRTHHFIGNKSGFTLIEIVMVIVAIGILAIVAIPKFGNMIAGSKEAATKDELRTLKIALVGSAQSNVRGYENDVGLLPPSLIGLAVKPAGVGNWDRFTQTGWHGPYIDTTGGEYLKDAWGSTYIYSQAARKIMSIGSGDTITAIF
jgi:prepilin-type N-terminal cleavage/methylation domain-containing protein